MPKLNRDANNDDVQLDGGSPVAVVPDGAKSEGEIEREKSTDEDDAAQIDPKSRIPRPVQPDLA